MPALPTERSLSLMRERGYTCFRVEHWNPFARRRVDLCGCDLLALKVGEPPTLIQATTASHRNARAEKLDSLESARLWIDCGGKILIHGWRPLTKSRRKYEIIEVEWGRG